MLITIDTRDPAHVMTSGQTQPAAEPEPEASDTGLPAHEAGASSASAGSLGAPASAMPDAGGPPDWLVQAIAVAEATDQGAGTTGHDDVAEDAGKGPA